LIELETLEILQKELKERIEEDKQILDEMRAEVRPLKFETRRIQPRSARMISLVGTDGGNNQFRFDPFQIQLVRVVDSNRKDYGLEVITPQTSIVELNRRHLDFDGSPKTVLGKMMVYLGVSDLSDLSPVFKIKPNDELANSWMNVYREMTEWAVLFHLVRDKDYGNDTVVVCDGFLRSKMFATKMVGGNSTGLFGKYREGLEEGIRHQFEKNKRRIYVCGVAKHSSVLQAYRVAMALEGVMRNTYPCYLEVPGVMEKRAYKWPEYFVRTDMFVSGKMFLVKFGNGVHDPVWAIDLLLSQKGEAQTILGYLLEDAKDGFPIPLYPQCLQLAHENAALVGFDMELLDNEICKALRDSLGDKKWVIDELALQETDPSARRYS
jgi:hypothetical protein